MTDTGLVKVTAEAMAALKAAIVLACTLHLELTRSIRKWLSEPTDVVSRAIAGCERVVR